MKYLISLFFILTTMNINAAWEYVVFNDDKSKIYSAHAFDDNIENSITLSCDNEHKNLIIGLIPNTHLSDKKSNIISFTFDNKPKIKFIGKYKKESAFITNNIFDEVNQPTNKKMKDLVKHLKESSKLKIGLVSATGKSHFFNITMKDSSKSINQLLKKCSI